MKTAFHSGDLGDVVLALPACREIGEVKLHLATRPWTKEFTRVRFETVKPLLEAQPYIVGLVHGECEKPDYDFSTFRKGGMPWGENIVDIQSNWVIGRGIPYRPWLTAGVDKASCGRVLVHRSPRYHNPCFCWETVIKKLGSRALSICFPDEHLALEEVAGAKIERIQLRDYLHLAELINGSLLFVGNQSSPMAVATGLGHPAIQETCLWIPDCIYAGAPIQYAYNGDCVIDGVPVVSPLGVRLRPDECPPGGWRARTSVGREVRGLVMRNVAVMLAGEDNIALEAAQAAVVAENTTRVLRDCPSFMGLQGQSPGRMESHLRRLGISGSVSR